MGTTTIEWTQEVWNPVRGCSLVSKGCQSCYAMKQAHRFSGPGQPYEGLTKLTSHGPVWTGKVITVPSLLDAPLRMRKPKRIFVNSMSDLFHEDVPDEFIDRVFDLMWRCPQHTFQILTKRVDRMVAYVRSRASVRMFGWTEWERTPIKPGEVVHLDDIRMRNICGHVGDKDWSCQHQSSTGDEDSCGAPHECPIAFCVDERSKLEAIGLADQYSYGSDGHAEDSSWMEFCERPLHAACGNVWLGFSAEDQLTFTERMREFRNLREILGPHFTLFVSLEPLLGPIGFEIPFWPDEETYLWNALEKAKLTHGDESHYRPYLDWVIVGGESGPKARPMHPDWARSLRDQCKAAGVPFMFKQWGEWLPWTQYPPGPPDDAKAEVCWPNGAIGGGSSQTHGGVGQHLVRVGKKAAGRLLDGELHDEYPR